MAEDTKKKIVSFGFPFDSKQQQTPEGAFYDDREYLAADFARYFKQFIGNGVYAQPANGLKVSASGNMGIAVNKGDAFVDGYHGHSGETTNLILDEGNASLGRIDRVVMRLNLLNRQWEIAIVKGTPQAVPKAPDLQRYTGEAGNYYELGLATISVKANAVSITDTEITDTRLNKNVCGIVSGVIEQIDTTALYTQYESFLSQSIQNWTTIKEQQQQAWEQQTQQQEIEFKRKMTEIDAWYSGVKDEIAKLQIFDFDNFAALSNAVRETVISGSTSTETIKNSSNNKLIATRITNLTTLQQVIKIYNDDGVGVKSTRTISVDFSAPGVIAKETVVAS